MSYYYLQLCLLPFWTADVSLWTTIMEVISVSTFCATTAVPKTSVGKQSTYMCFLVGLFYTLLFDQGLADSKVPIVTDHNNQIRMKIGDRLKLECPIHSTPSGRLVATREPVHSDNGQPFGDLSSGVLYHWKVRDRLDYSLDLDPRFHFSPNRRVLEVTVPLEVSDSGTYTCMGVTGFGKREVEFQVHVRDPDANLLCAPPSPLHPDLESPCFVDSTMKDQPSITVEQPAGSLVHLSCEADGSPPIRYQWLAGSSVVDDRPIAGPESRGPYLTIPHVGREHAGQYICQVTNVAGSLNYTYQLIVTNPPAASPKIITAAHNYTFSADSSGTMMARVQCACEDPTIQWLKRVEPGEVLAYEKAGTTKISLPNARESEINEVYVMIGSSSGSQADANHVVTYVTERVSNGISQQTQSSEAGSGGRQLGTLHRNYQSVNSIEHAFVTRLHLQKPFTKKKHQGKYVLMTMNLADVKKMQYIVMYVDVIEDTTFLRGRRILIYFMIPFCLLFICIGALAYFLVFRRRRHSRRPFTSGNDRGILRTVDIGPSTYQVIPNGKKTSRQSFGSKPLLNVTNTTLGVPKSGANHTNCNSLFPPTAFCPSQLCGNGESNGGLLLPIPSPESGFHCGGQNVNQQVASSTLSHSLQNSGQTDATSLTMPPPVTNSNSSNVMNGLVSGRVTACGGGAGSAHQYPMVTSHHIYNPYSHPNNPHHIISGSTQYYSDSQTQAPHHIATTNTNMNQQYQHNSNSSTNKMEPNYPTMVGDEYPTQQQQALFSNFRMTNTPSNVTEVSFDPYSAVGQSPISSSTLTNHYTAPFTSNDYSTARHFGVNGLPIDSAPQQHKLGALHLSRR